MLPNLAVFEQDEHQSFRHSTTGKAAALLLHGFPGTPAEMRPFADLLSSRGWAVAAPLLPGFGADLGKLPRISYQAWLHVARAELRALRSEYEQVIVVGNSMGGALAVRLAAENTVDGLILIAPFWKLEGTAWRLIPVLRYLLPSFHPFKLFKPDFTDAKTQEAIRKFLPDVDLSDPKIQKDILNFAIPMRIIDQIRSAGMKAHQASVYVTCSTLVIQGTNDNLVQPHLTRELISKFRGFVQYIELNGDHELHQPDAPFWKDLESAIQRFLERPEYEVL